MHASNRSVDSVFSKAAFGPRLLFWAGLCLLTSSVSTQAAVVRSVGAYTVTFYDSGESDESGTGSQNWTSAQIDAVISSVTTWSSRISDSAGRQVQLHLFWNSLGSSILGQTSNLTTSNGSTTYSSTEYVWREGNGTAGSTSYDARISLSTGMSWNTSTDDAGSSQYDLRSVITHELGHTLGFFSTYSSSTDTFSSSGISTWDKLLVDSSGNTPKAGSTGTPSNFNQKDNPVYFIGSNAIAVYGGSVPVYAPTTYSSGSSLSHLDESLLPDALMSPAIASGETVREPTTLEWAILKDLGWSVTTEQTWTNGAGTLTWNNAANWSSGVTPNADYNIIFTSAGLSGGATIQLGGSRTTNALTIDGSVNFTLGAGTDSLKLNGGYIMRTATSSGTQTIAASLNVGSNTVWNIAGDGSLVIAGAWSATDSITKIGVGNLSLAAAAVVPDDLNIDNGDFTLTNGGSLSVENIYGVGGAINLDGGSLNVTGDIDIYGFRVGSSNVGSFTLKSGKTLTAGTFLTIGRNSGGNGSFINQGGTILAETNLFSAANAGSIGSFTQSSGLTTVASITYIGYQSGSSGTMLINGGTLTTAYLESGFSGTGAYTQNGGSVNASTAVHIGYSSGGSGVMSVNAGTLFSPYVYVGASGSGTFNLAGGTCSISKYLYLGYSSGITGTFNLSATGSLSAASEVFGVSGIGIFTQTGGIHAISSDLSLGYSSGSTGIYNLEGGTLILKSLTQGAGTAAFHFGGGTLQASDDFTISLDLTLTGTDGNATLNTAGYDVTLSGDLTGNGGLTKKGTGTLILSGDNTYTGETTVYAGILNITSEYAGGEVTVSNGAGIIFGEAYSTSSAPLVALTSALITTSAVLSPATSEVTFVPVPEPSMLFLSGFLIIPAIIMFRQKRQ